MQSWLLLSAISKATALYKRCPEGKVVFGSKRRLIERSQGRITMEEWKARRLWPLEIEGHARSFGKQGSNHLVTLDMANRRLVLHGPDKTDYELKLRLSSRSRSYRKRLDALQEHCETLRRARRRLFAPLHSGPPRRPSVREQRSQVLCFDPRSGTSDVFGFDFNLLLAG